MEPRFAVRRGVTRTVLLAGRWAFKFPSLRSHGKRLRGVMWSLARGLSANLSEAEWSGQEGLCPVLWSAAGLVNVYPRCEPASEDLTDDVYAAIGFNGPMDKKPANLGWLNGTLVWVDYDMNWNDRPPCMHRGGDRA
ncbi:hypothetical protein BBK82_03260 [Lentzea guizhouensis]|uniref:Uncharacterized protein n=1 Tax=Lentzea guizhouensis TaxID=1586287 RepID=A0A1B2HC24_9PSEU|nr:hypothetical protein [Lentzea guizhouensis]ANZ35236.1 hypothetical protein BBK82_03260 [Lentzea guizhouensis]